MSAKSKSQNNPLYDVTAVVTWSFFFKLTINYHRYGLLVSWTRTFHIFDIYNEPCDAIASRMFHVRPSSTSTNQNNFRLRPILIAIPTTQQHQTAQKYWGRLHIRQETLLPYEFRFTWRQLMLTCNKTCLKVVGIPTVRLNLSFNQNIYLFNQL